MNTTGDRERADLALCERHIANGERQVVRQAERVEQFRAIGLDSVVAADTLQVFQDALTQHRRHRELILERLAQLDS